MFKKSKCACCPFPLVKGEIYRMWLSDGKWVLVCEDCADRGPVREGGVMSKPTPTPSQLIAKQKVQKALELIEQAQRLISDAGSELSPICWGAKEHKQVCDFYDKVKALWYRVEPLRNSTKIDLDSETKRRLGLS